MSSDFTDLNIKSTGGPSDIEKYKDKKKTENELKTEKVSKQIISNKTTDEKKEVEILGEKTITKEVNSSGIDLKVESGEKILEITVKKSKEQEKESGIEEKIKQHRNPINPKTDKPFTAKEFENDQLTKKRDTLLDEKIKDYKVEHNKTPDLRTVTKMKEEACQEVYDKHINDNVEKGFYNPSAINAEIKSVLKVSDEIPKGIQDKDSAIKAIKEELKKFREGMCKKDDQILTNELYHHLEHDIKDTMELYLNVYPEKTAEDAFVVCRDMARAILYQTKFDKSAFSGSDHGVLHAHHNCENGDHMHQKMDEGDMSLKAQLLSKIMHYYHDIGYSVGAGKDFSIAKDHPFIGAKYIESNKDYFEKYLGKDETDIIKKSILYHAIVAFENNKDDDLSMVRFTTSNSDACAVTSDQKTQSFWRENPETLLQLAKLRQFLTIYPEYGGFDKLSSSNIIKNPEKVFKLKDTSTPLDLSENNFENKLDYSAWTVFSTVRDELLKVADKQELPKEEKKAFKDAIENCFNSFTGDIVLAQYGAELNDVSVVENDKKETNYKYLPAVDLSPSILFTYLQSCYSKETAGQNIRKLCKSEYGANEKEIDLGLDKIGNGNEESVKIKTEVALITLTKQKEIKHKDIRLEKVTKKLVEIQEISIPIKMRVAVTEVINLAKELEKTNKDDKMNENAKNEKINTLKKSIVEKRNSMTEALIESEEAIHVSDLVIEMTDKVIKGEKIDQNELLNIRTSLSNEEEWKMMGLTKPKSN